MVRCRDAGGPGVGFVRISSAAQFSKVPLPQVVGAGALCQEQDCKQLCKRMVYTFYVQL